MRPSYNKFLEVKFNTFALLLLSLIGTSAFADLNFDPSLVRAWNSSDKSEYPTPLAAIFKKDSKQLMFVGDHHVDQTKTSIFTEKAMNNFSPQIVVVEGVNFEDGENPKKWIKRFKGQSKDDLLKQPGAGPYAAYLAMKSNMPVIGGEPTIQDAMKSSFLLSKGYSAEDIRNVQVLQRIPYRRDIEKKSAKEFFDYAVAYYKIDQPASDFQTAFKVWYAKKAQKPFNYDLVTKDESAVNCAKQDTLIQAIACSFNIFRDRELVAHVEALSKKFDRVMVVYGTGHFVQEYLVYVKAFGSEPKFLK